MDTEKIILLKLFNGEMIIGEISSTETSDKYSLKNPRQIIIVPSMAGDIRIMMGTISEPFKVKRLKENIDIPTSQVMFKLEEDELEKELIDGYKSEISGLKIATAAEASALKAISNPGEFVL